MMSFRHSPSNRFVTDVGYTATRPTPAVPGFCRRSRVLFVAIVLAELSVAQALSAVCGLPLALFLVGFSALLTALLVQRLQVAGPRR